MYQNTGYYNRDGENEIDLNEVYQENDVSIPINVTPSKEVDIPTVLVSGDYEEVNLLIEDEEDDMHGDENEEDGMEEVKDEDEETFSDDSDDNKEHDLAYSEKQVDNVTSAHNSHGSISIPLGASGDGTSSRSRGKGPSVGLQTPTDPFERLLITPIG
ncbi:Uncharacterized protein TCM_039979 [Theobroma cacao]|uniref:Uncharacterized protein n=1 Tax=Theobroma cacao TaxID=3641 RepID=A0A061GS99_THECC|nr:Uncharacterized protein TCM_039979 [Theobroma cacao]